MRNPQKHSVFVYLVGAVIVGAAAALPAGVAWAFTHPPRRLHRQNPRSALGIAYERVHLRAEDDVRLSGWYVPAAPAEDDTPPRGVVIVCHGYYGNRGTMLPYLSFLHRERFACLLFDFRAHGWSGGRRATFGANEGLDLQAAIDWVSEQEELRDIPLAVLGESMGASVSLMVSAQDERVRAVVADSAFARFDSAVEGRLKLAFGPAASTIMPHASRFGERLLGCRITDIAPEEAIKRIAPRPVLLIHGTRDRLISVENVHRLQEAAPGNAALWEVEGVGHCGAVYVMKEEYARRVAGFLKETLRNLQKDANAFPENLTGEQEPPAPPRGTDL